MKSDLWCARMIAALALAAPSTLRADVLTLNSGKSLKGIVEEQPDRQGPVTFTGASGKQLIPRDRVKSIQKESKAQGYIHIGDEHARLGNTQQAMAAYQQALREDAQSKDAQERVRTTQQALDQQKMTRRQEDIQQIETLKSQIRELIRQKQFEKSEQMLKSASDLVPTSAQKGQLQDIVGELYLAWAKDRLDKLDRAGAEEKLNLALAARPDNDQTIELMLKLWEGQPEKKEQLLRIYETVLARRPDDEVLRLKVGDLLYDSGNLDEAIVHYLKLYNATDKYKGTALEERVKQALERLHMQAAQKKDFDQAILFFNMLAKIEPKTDATSLQYYEYMKRAAAVAGDDIPGRLDLAKFAEDRQLEAVALQNYRRVLELDAKNEAAKAALNRFAMHVIEQSQEQFNKQDYYLAKTLAQQAQQDFPESQEAKLKADEIIGRSNNEIVRDKREKRELAKEYVQRGDTCYQQALTFYRDISNTQVKGTALLSTPKNDALRHFRCAIAAYETAIKIDQTLADDPASLVGTNLNWSRQYVQRLTQPPPRVGFDQSLRPLR